MEEIRIFKPPHVHYRGGAWNYPCSRCAFGGSIPGNPKCESARKTIAIGEFECFKYAYLFQIVSQTK
jgi:hypothetical protein